MSAPDPSPLPWHDDDGFIKDATGKIVDMRETNRLLIISAVNPHDALLAAAREALRVIPLCEDVCAEMLEAAIAAAEEQAQ